MIDYSALAFPKGESRRDHKLTKQATERAEDKAAREQAWARCKGRCEFCHKPVKRGGGLIDGAEFHHDTPRSLGGRRVPVYRVGCHGCHFNGPSGAHRGRH